MRDLDVADRFVESDVVVDQRGNQGLARRHRNRDTGEPFWSVVLTAGPDKRAGKVWGRASDFTPVLGIDGGTVRNTCEICSRAFLSRPRVLDGGMVIPLDSYCKTHQARGRLIEQQRARDAGSVAADRNRAHAPTHTRPRDDGSGSPF